MQLTGIVRTNVQRGTGVTCVIYRVLLNVGNKSVTETLATAMVVIMVSMETDVVKREAIRKMAGVYMNAWLETLGKHVKTYVVYGVLSRSVIAEVETVLMDVCRAGMANTVTVSIIFMKYKIITYLYLCIIN